MSSIDFNAPITSLIALEENLEFYAGASDGGIRIVHVNKNLYFVYLVTEGMLADQVSSTSIYEENMCLDAVVTSIKHNPIFFKMA